MTYFAFTKTLAAAPANIVTAGVPVDVTGSRVAGNPGTVYQNTSGKPLIVTAAADINSNNTNLVRLYVGSTNVPGTMTNISYFGGSNLQGATGTVNGIVPVDYYYRVELFETPAASPPTIVFWLEQP